MEVRVRVGEHVYVSSRLIAQSSALSRPISLARTTSDEVVDVLARVLG